MQQRCFCMQRSLGKAHHARMKSRPTSPARIAQVGQTSHGVLFVVVVVGDCWRVRISVWLMYLSKHALQHNIQQKVHDNWGKYQSVHKIKETAILLKHLRESCWPPIAEGIALGIPVWQFVLNTGGSGNCVSKNLLMSAESPIFLPLNSKTGTCI